MTGPSSRGPGDPDESGAPGEPQEPLQTDLDLEAPPVRGSRTPGWMRPAAVVAAIAVAAGAAVAYRAHHRAQVLRDGMARAQLMLRADTAAGYRDAARLLDPLARLDPIQAGSMRAFALAMLFADYRDARAADQAEALLVEPGRAPEVLETAQLAYAALALGRQQAGTATTFAARAPGPMGLTLLARTSLLAGNLGAAAESLEHAVEADPTFPAALALRGDVQRRSGMAGDARRSYEAALAASPNHARAAFGLGKLALSGLAGLAEARDALSRVLDDREGTLDVERAHAALLLAPLQARAGDRAGAAAAIDKAGLEPPARSWLERAVAEQELNRAGYRVAAGTPPSLRSASDDDPYVAPPPAPPRLEPARPAAKKAHAVAKKRPAKKMVKKPSKKKKKAPVRKGVKKKAPAKKNPAAKRHPRPVAQ